MSALFSPNATKVVRCNSHVMIRELLNKLRQFFALLTLKPEEEVEQLNSLFILTSHSASNKHTYFDLPGISNSPLMSHQASHVSVYTSEDNQRPSLSFCAVLASVKCLPVK